ncbi:hypothetical protein BV25DRAFT_1057773 [Artomyces pyxidatus]|uniref:Uncharacterized protein n=1 Tax=Artomyces pyxidatus TaxID=48021 RepID=A0ACB8STS7_9AGAM|nr:hypothetical protein BV25DRAFT_1057773 [Artomyces pyxidatus]
MWRLMDPVSSTSPEKMDLWATTENFSRRQGQRRDAITCQDRPTGVPAFARTRSGSIGEWSSKDYVEGERRRGSEWKSSRHSRAWALGWGQTAKRKLGAMIEKNHGLRCGVQLGFSIRAAASTPSAYEDGSRDGCLARRPRVVPRSDTCYD